MPFCPPYEIKTLFGEDDTDIQNFITWDASYRGDYDNESFAGFHYKIIEYVAVKTRYCDVTGGRLVSSKTKGVFEKCFLSDVRHSLWEICAK